MLRVECLPVGPAEVVEQLDQVQIYRMQIKLANRNRFQIQGQGTSLLLGKLCKEVHSRTVGCKRTTMIDQMKGNFGKMNHKKGLDIGWDCWILCHNYLKSMGCIVTREILGSMKS